MIDDESPYDYFQQDSDTVYATQNSVSALPEVFDARIISAGLWPPRLLDPSI